MQSRKITEARLLPEAVASFSVMCLALRRPTKIETTVSARMLSESGVAM